MAPRVRLALLLLIGAGFVADSAHARVTTPPPAPPVSLTASDGSGLRIVSYQARAAIEDPLAFTELHLAFHNPEPRQIEGQFEITLPPGAVVSRFAMRQPTGWQEGEVVELQAAREAYEDFLHRRQDPALLEKQAGNRFHARVFPIPASGVKELIISYSQELTNTEEPYKLPLYGLPKLDQLDIRVLLGKREVAQASSTLGGVTMAHDVIDVQKRAFTPDVDFAVPLPASDNGSRLGLRHDNLTVARITPVTDAAPDKIDALLVLFDTSASRALGFGAQVDRLGQVLDAIKQNAGAQTPVKVACFDQDVQEVYSGPVSGFGAAARNAILERRALGASDLERALAWAARDKERTWSRVLIVTDGVATAGATDGAELRKAVSSLGNAGVKRVDALVVGGIRDEGALKRLVTGGLSRDGVVLDDALDSPMVARKLASATWSGIKISAPGAAWVWPVEVNGVQPGDQVLVYADLPPNKPLEIVLEGARAGRHPVKLQPVERPLLERAWVSARIKRLEHQRETLASSDPDLRDALKKQIVELSTKFRVLSDYTALLVLESESDYARFHIDRRALADILVVGGGGVEVMNRRNTISISDDTVAETTTTMKQGGGEVDGRFRQEELKPPTTGRRIPVNPTPEKPAKADKRGQHGEGGGGDVLHHNSDAEEGHMGWAGGGKSRTKAPERSGVAAGNSTGPGSSNGYAPPPVVTTPPPPPPPPRHRFSDDNFQAQAQIQQRDRAQRDVEARRQRELERQGASPRTHDPEAATERPREPMRPASPKPSPVASEHRPAPPQTIVTRPPSIPEPPREEAESRSAGNDRGGSGGGGDRDGDGIPDSVDRCPNEPETYNGVDDQDGCPDRGRVIVSSSRITILEHIYFQPRSRVLQPQSFPILDAIVATLRGNPQLTRVEIQGHADERAGESVALTGGRAEAVRYYLVQHGVDPARLLARGYGATRPICGEHTEQCWARNRRVEFVILQTDVNDQVAQQPQPPPRPRDQPQRPQDSQPRESFPYEGRLAEIMTLIKTQKTDAALKTALAWHDAEPGDVLALIAVGESAEAAQKRRLAARAYGSLIDLFPSRADVRRFAGERLERLSDGLALAIDTYKKARADRPDHPASHRLLAYALLRANEPAAAFEVIVEGAQRQYPDGRFRGVDRILREDVGLVAAAWARKEPKRRAQITERLAALGVELASSPSLRFVLNWETDANDVDFHIFDAQGGHAYYSSKVLPTGGELYADVTTGYGPECFTITGKPSAFPYKLQAHYYSRGPMGYGMGKLEIIEHDGQGGLKFEERPFVIMIDHAFVDLGSVSGPLASR
jgi:outer membrane protein OmpA-like peptidoglycan-associated protein